VGDAGAANATTYAPNSVNEVEADNVGTPIVTDFRFDDLVQ